MNSWAAVDVLTRLPRLKSAERWNLASRYAAAAAVPAIAAAGTYII